MTVRNGTANGIATFLDLGPEVTMAARNKNYKVKKSKLFIKFYFIRLRNLKPVEHIKPKFYH
jgi:hypothetical protein